jgi:hypothetical protein
MDCKAVADIRFTSFFPLRTQSRQCDIDRAMLRVRRFADYHLIRGWADQMRW